MIVIDIAAFLICLFWAVMYAFDRNWRRHVRQWELVMLWSIVGAGALGRIIS